MTSPPPAISTFPLHDALPICFSVQPPEEVRRMTQPLVLAVPDVTRAYSIGHWFILRVAGRWKKGGPEPAPPGLELRSEEHTSELQSRENLVCRLLLEKKKRQR